MQVFTQSSHPKINGKPLPWQELVHQAVQSYLLLPSSMTNKIHQSFIQTKLPIIEQVYNWDPTGLGVKWKCESASSLTHRALNNCVACQHQMYTYTYTSQAMLVSIYKFHPKYTYLFPYFICLRCWCRSKPRCLHVISLQN